MNLEQIDFLERFGQFSLKGRNLRLLDLDRLGLLAGVLKHLLEAVDFSQFLVGLLVILIVGQRLRFGE